MEKREEGSGGSYVKLRFLDLEESRFSGDGSRSGGMNSCLF